VAADLKCHAETFLTETLIKEFGKTNGVKVKLRLLAICEDISNNGFSPRMSPERGPIYGIKWEFKKKLVRIACFQDGNKWVLTHGFFKQGAQKKKGVWSVEHLDRADRIREQHFAHFAKGSTPPNGTNNP